LVPVNPEQSAESSTPATAARAILPWPFHPLRSKR
jgi:hypothetical protein